MILIISEKHQDKQIKPKRKQTLTRAAWECDKKRGDGEGTTFCQPPSQQSGHMDTGTVGQRLVVALTGAHGATVLVH